MATKEQRKIWQTRWNKNHPEQYREYYKRQLNSVKKKYKENPEFRKKCINNSKRYWEKNKEKIKERRKNSPSRKLYNRLYNLSRQKEERDYRLRKQYGISIEQYEKMLIKQNNVCAICGNEETCRDKWKSPHRRLRVDHDKKTGRVRGLLCHQCNVGIGHLKDNPLILNKAIEYLKSSFL